MTPPGLRLEVWHIRNNKANFDTMDIDGLILRPLLVLFETFWVPSAIRVDHFHSSYSMLGPNIKPFKSTVALSNQLFKFWYELFLYSLWYDRVDLFNHILNFNVIVDNNCLSIFDQLSLQLFIVRTESWEFKSGTISPDYWLLLLYLHFGPHSGVNQLLFNWLLLDYLWLLIWLFLICLVSFLLIKIIKRRLIVRISRRLTYLVIYL